MNEIVSAVMPKGQHLVNLTAANEMSEYREQSVEGSETCGSVGVWRLTNEIVSAVMNEMSQRATRRMK